MSISFLFYSASPCTRVRTKTSIFLLVRTGVALPVSVDFLWRLLQKQQREYLAPRLPIQSTETLNLANSPN